MEVLFFVYSATFRGLPRGGCSHLARVRRVDCYSPRRSVRPPASRSASSRRKRSNSCLECVAPRAVRRARRRCDWPPPRVARLPTREIGKRLKLGVGHAPPCLVEGRRPSSPSIEHFDWHEQRLEQVDAGRPGATGSDVQARSSSLRGRLIRACPLPDEVENHGQGSDRNDRDERLWSVAQRVDREEDKNHGSRRDGHQDDS